VDVDVIDVSGVHVAFKVDVNKVGECYCTPIHRFLVSLSGCFYFVRYIKTLK
jgi:hypothetical protein